MRELAGNVKNFETFMKAIELSSTMPIRFADIGQADGYSKGYCDYEKKEIVIQEGMSGFQTIKTALHEVSHAILHDKDVMIRLGRWKERETREAEAESIAHTVCLHFGIDTSDYSRPYIDGWCDNMDPKELSVIREVAKIASRHLIAALEENLRFLGQEQTADGETLESKTPGRSDNKPWEKNRTNEDFFIRNDQNCFAIYQIDTGSKGKAYHYMGIETMMKYHLMIDRADYRMVYCDALKEEDTLDSLFEKFNMARPHDFHGCSMSVSDVVAFHREGKIMAYYVDSFGFRELRGFVKQREQEMGGQKTEKASTRQSVLDALRRRQARLREQEKKSEQKILGHEKEAL